MTIFARTPLALVLLAIGMSVPFARAQQIPYSHGNPTALEQYMLELVNYARTNPALEGVFLNDENTPYAQYDRSNYPSYYTNLPGDFAAYPSVPPLAFNPILIGTARAHSQDEIANDYFAHDSLDGTTPFERMTDAGYDFIYAEENIADQGASDQADVLEAHYGFMIDCANVDAATDPLGHRLNILNSNVTEIGIGIVGPLERGQITQDFGNSNAAQAFIVGVAYSDVNSNGFYDPGEGLSNVTVTPNFGGYYAVTSASGGYAIPIQPVQTNTVTVNIPLAVSTAPWSNVEVYNQQFIDQEISNTPSMPVALTWSGGGIPSPVTNYVTIKEPILINYQLVGTDHYYYPLSMVTASSVKADYVLGEASPAPSPTPPPSITSEPESQIVSKGGNATFSVGVTGKAPSYQWYFDTNTPVSGATNATLVLTNVQTSGTYDVVVSNARGSVTSSTARLTVLPNAPSFLTATPGVKAVTLTYAAVTNAKFYVVYRSKVSGGSFTKIATTTTTKYIDYNVIANTTYYYVVIACDGMSLSGYSTQASATPNR